MAPKHFLLLGFVLTLVLGAIKFVFYNVLAGDSAVFNYVEWALIVLAAIAAVRRLGIINYLEAIFAAVCWWLFSLIFDFLITSAFAGLEIFRDVHLWIGYLVMMLAIFLFHKKRHVQLRHEMNYHH